MIFHDITRKKRIEYGGRENAKMEMERYRVPTNIRS